MTGALRWQSPIGGAVSSSPTVYAGVVYVGSPDGSLYALDALTGARRWSQATGGAVTSTPTVSGTSVFVGSGGGSVLSLQR